LGTLLPRRKDSEGNIGRNIKSLSAHRIDGSPIPLFERKTHDDTAIRRGSVKREKKPTTARNDPIGGIAPLGPSHTTRKKRVPTNNKEPKQHRMGLVEAISSKTLGGPAAII